MVYRPYYLSNNFATVERKGLLSFAIHEIYWETVLRSDDHIHQRHNLSLRFLPYNEKGHSEIIYVNFPNKLSFRGGSSGYVLLTKITPSVNSCSIEDSKMIRTHLQPCINYTLDLFSTDREYEWKPHKLQGYINFSVNLSSYGKSILYSLSNKLIM